MKTAKNREIDYGGLALMNKSSFDEITLNFDEWKDTSILLDIATLKNMSSGTCIISQGQESAIAVCKEGRDVKVFKICRKETGSLICDRDNIVTIEE